MKSIADHSSMSPGVHTAVLMARLVDPQGKCMNPAAIQSIEYSLFEVAKGRRKRPVRGHVARRLNINEVVLAGLQNDDAWDVDCSGYNFRHEISVARSEVPAGGDVCYELLYLIRNTTGEESIVQFRVRMFCHD
ncbi:MAG TPA: hypothetical protein VHU84_02085 [Lacipirellulaceae bacterium]|nr:hypothetical protein [Lacipirellulaceae bacterium]